MAMLNNQMVPLCIIHFDFWIFHEINHPAIKGYPIYGTPGHPYIIHISIFSVLHGELELRFLSVQPHFL